MAWSGRDDLALIEDVVWVERHLDCAHHGKTGAELGLEVLGLALTHPVLPRTGPFHGDGALDQPFQKPLHGGELAGIVAIKYRRRVKVTIADVADDRRDQPRGFDVLLRGHDALGQP